MTIKLSRRTFLAGVGGSAVALPFLDAMASDARAASGGPCRYLVCFTGISLQTDVFKPGSFGTGYELTGGLAPLAGRNLATVAPGLDHNPMVVGDDYDDVRDEFSVVSNLHIPWDTGSGNPPAGRPVDFHSSTTTPLLTGMRKAAGERGANITEGPTSDQIVTETLNDGTERFRSLEYRVQASSYKTDNSGGSRSRMSYRLEDGRVVPNPPIASPRIAFDTLFSGFTPPDPIEARRAAAALDRDRSVLDNVLQSSERLRNRLGTADRRRLDGYFEQVRELERRAREIPDIPPGGNCHLLPDPGDDPAIRHNPCDPTTDDDCDRYPYENGSSDEDQRARVLFDLTHMAFACDLSRVASIQFTYPQTYLNMQNLTGVNNDGHSIGHSGGDRPRNMSDMMGWHLKHLARFVDKLRNTPDGDATLLDRTVVVLVLEGGWGFDPEGNRDNNAHSTNDMTAIIAGRAGGLRQGQHIDGRDRHPASVVLSAMRAVGHTGGLGEVDEVIDELF